MIVMKFGGTSVESAEAIERVAGIVKSRLDRKPVVVVSAMGKTTNRLLKIANLAVTGQRDAALGELIALRDYHLRESGMERTVDEHFQELSELVPGSILDTDFHRDRATLIADPSKVHDILAQLRSKGYTFLASLHGVDYYPDEPRLGILYELLDMQRVDRITVKARVPTDAPTIRSVVDIWTGADFPEREVYDMFGVNFEGHPDMRRILMPEDYEGFPQRRDFPVGGEPVLFTFNAEQTYGKHV